MIITDEFAQKIEDVIGITRWKNIINNRDLRIALEVAIAIVCRYFINNKEKYSAFGAHEKVHVIG